jgi:hypothetical protein
MKRTTQALALIVALLSVIVTVQVVKVAEANPIDLSSPPPSLIISIQSPAGGGRYLQDSVSLVAALKLPSYPGYSFPYPHGDIQYVAYSLDGQTNMTLTGNTTLPELSFGSHSLTVYANDTVGLFGASETEQALTAQTETEPFSIAAVAVVSGAAITAIGASLLMHFQKRNR